MNYGITLVTPPSGQVVTTADLRSHLRLNTTDEDTLLATYLTVAVDVVQRWTGRQLLTATVKAYFDEWPTVIPLPPLQSVSAVKYYDVDGVETTFTDYTLDKTVDPARLIITEQPNPGLSDEIKPTVNIQYVCGYGAAGDVPPMLSHAVRLIAGSYYLLREAVVPTLGDLIQPPYGVQAMLANYRVFL